MTRRSYTSKVKKGIIRQAPMALRDLIAQQFPFALMHSCGQIAFYLKREPEIGQPIMPEDVIMPNGNAVQGDDKAVCGHCGKDLTHQDMQPENIRRVQ